VLGFLKKKLSEVVDSISAKVRNKAEEQPELQTSLEGQKLEETQVEIEEAIRQPDRIETVVEVPTREASGETEAEVIEVDFEGRKKDGDSVAEESAGSFVSGGKMPVPEPEKLPEKTSEAPIQREAFQTPGSAPADVLNEPSDKMEILPEKEIADAPMPKRAEDEAAANHLLEMREAGVRDRKSFFKRLTEKVVKTVTEKRLSKEDVLPMLESLESGLIEADVAVDVAEKVGNDLLDALTGSEIRRGREKEVILSTFRKSLLDILNVPKVDFEYLASQKKPVLIAFWGFNGAGKTTSLAKTASWLKQKGYTCCFAAADTFRAGAEEQLEIHADRLGVKIIKHKYGADPAAVIFDAVEHARSKGIDFVLADTAGRAHTNMNLMEQMKKIVRVNKPDLKVLVIDSLTGNDALEQARSYGEVGVDAVIFTKVDVNEKGGAVLSVTHELKKPIIFLGMGQDYGDFQEFDAERFVDTILGTEKPLNQN